MIDFLHYGTTHPDLADVPPNATQVSPFAPGATKLSALEPASCGGLAMLAPPNSAERSYEMATALRALKPGAAFTIMAPKDRGGSRLAKELRGFGCDIVDEPRRHHRICTGVRPDTLIGIEEALAAGGPRHIEAIDAISQPGLFSWDRMDAGTGFLIEVLPKLSGTGADFGCGWGALSRAVLAKNPAVTSLTGIDLDWRAIVSASANITDPRFHADWRDIRADGAGLERLDFIIANPPFHATGREDRGLGQAFIEQAAKALHKGGRLWLVANLHLPYEIVLNANFARWEMVDDNGSFKVIEAVR